MVCAAEKLVPMPWLRHVPTDGVGHIGGRHAAGLVLLGVVRHGTHTRVLLNRWPPGAATLTTERP